ncbi:uncharacterized protein V6R79_024346 [Siganus canaliculatus]
MTDGRCLVWSGLVWSLVAVEFVFLFSPRLSETELLSHIRILYSFSSCRCQLSGQATATNVEMFSMKPKLFHNSDCDITVHRPSHLYPQTAIYGAVHPSKHQRSLKSVPCGLNPGSVRARNRCKNSQKSVFVISPVKSGDRPPTVQPAAYLLQDAAERKLPPGLITACFTSDKMSSLSALEGSSLCSHKPQQHTSADYIDPDVLQLMVL